MIETGTILQNRYRIDKQIGQGGMGNVYVATDERFKSVVAIKETIFEDKNLRKAFEREARLLNSLKHSALPRVSDHFNEEDGQFLVMEYIAGEDLAEMMERNGEAFPLETVLNWAKQLCDALEYLHAQDIIHRDIKPQNLKLTPGGQIVLLDFGLAKGNATDAQHQTAAKSIFGFSRTYASLEQIQGAGTEPRSDLYSLSATLYHLLTGIPPADALTRAMNVLNGKSDPLIAANLVNNRVPRGVADVLQTTMALNAAERPESAASMRLMLDECDKSVDTNAAQSIAEKSLTADFLTQETKIMGAKTNATVNAQSEARTKIADSNASEENSYKTKIAGDGTDSKETVLRPVADTQSPRRRAKTVGAVVSGVLLLVGSVLSAGYLLNADSPRSEATTANTNSGNTNNVFVIKTENANISESNVSNANQTWAEKEKPVSSRNVVQSKEPDTLRNNVKEAKNQTQNSRASDKSVTQVGDSEKIVIDEKTVQMGDVIIDEKGIRDRKTGKSLIPVPPKPNIPPEHLKYLTPEQIRKLEEARNLQHLQRMEQIKKRIEDNRKRVYVVKTPSPQPTP
jgi:serine/threonine protein kinase